MNDVTSNRNSDYLKAHAEIESEASNLELSVARLENVVKAACQTIDDLRRQVKLAHAQGFEEGFRAAIKHGDCLQTVINELIAARQS